MKKEPNKCVYCGKPIVNRNKQAMYCSDACRVALYRESKASGVKTKVKEEIRTELEIRKEVQKEVNSYKIHLRERYEALLDAQKKQIRLYRGLFFAISALFVVVLLLLMIKMA
ncbi:MAG: hypothetical protein JW761_15240 [Prolixibacteraceae bacterium]|nr:hypothetical protein [Prolixibacteraceae bacterium]